MRKKGQRLVVWLVSAVALSGSLLVAFDGRYKITKAADIREGAVTLPASVVTVTNPGRNGQRTRVSYSFAGKPYTADLSAIEFKGHVPPGSELSILVDKSRPELAVVNLEKLYVNGIYECAAAGLLAAVSIALCALILVGKKRRGQASR